MRTTAMPSTRRARALVALVGIAGAIALSALPAGAAPTPTGSGPITTTPLPRVCQVVVGCRDETTFSFATNGDTIWAIGRFPQSTTGWVRFTLRCPDGYTKAATVTIPGSGYAVTKLSNHGEHPGLQTCTMTQNAAAKYTTYAYLGQPDPDELWSSKHVTFLNIAST